MTTTDKPQYKCPECGRTDQVNIYGGVWVRMEPSGAACGPVYDLEFTPASPAICAGCGHEATAARFRGEEEAKAPPQPIFREGGIEVWDSKDMQTPLLAFYRHSYGYTVIIRVSGKKPGRAGFFTLEEAIGYASGYARGLLDLQQVEEGRGR